MLGGKRGRSRDERRGAAEREIGRDLDVLTVSEEHHQCGVRARDRRRAYGPERSSISLESQHQDLRGEEGRREDDELEISFAYPFEEDSPSSYSSPAQSKLRLRESTAPSTFLPWLSEKPEDERRGEGREKVSSTFPSFVLISSFSDLALLFVHPNPRD